MKYSREKIIADLKFIYEKYGEITRNSINTSRKKYGTTSISVFDRIGCC